MFRLRRPPSRVSGFTLVELLVVIGVIGVLIAVLLPTLAKARKHAVEIACAANLRSWGQAFSIYAVQYKGLIPHCGDESRNPLRTQFKYDATAPQRESCYLDVLPPLMGRPPWKSFPLWQKPTDDIWQCPIAEILPDDSRELYGYRPLEVGYHSYAMNTFLECDQAYMHTDGTPPDPSFFNMARAKQPSVTLLMYEVTLNPHLCYGQNPIPVACYIGMYPDETPRGLAERHAHVKGKLGGNLMMLDGHVEWADQLWDSSLSNPEIPPRSNRTWWPN